MDVRWIAGDRVERCGDVDLASMVQREDGFVWVDLSASDTEGLAMVAELFGFHEVALEECRQLNIVPRSHNYADHLFVVVHGPHRGKRGQVHLLELDQFIGQRYLVTVHGPVGAGVDPELTMREATEAARLIDEGQLPLHSPMALSHELVGRLADRLEDTVGVLGKDVARLERMVMDSTNARASHGDAVGTLEELFGVRHELLTCRTIAGHSREVYTRLSHIEHMPVAGAGPVIQDLTDRFERTRGACEVEGEFLAGVIEFYQARTAARMDIATERLALIATLALPLTVVASIYGMNIIGPGTTDALHVVLVLLGMTIMSVGLLTWARRHGWW